MNSFGSVRGSIRGFTLIELLVAIVIIAVLATLAAPSFAQLQANRRMKNAAAELQSSIVQARSLAATYNRQVELWPAYTGTSAGTSNWNLPIATRKSSTINLPNAADSSKTSLSDALLSWYVVTPGVATGTTPLAIADSTANSYPIQVALPEQTLITVTTLPAAANPSALSGLRFYPAGYISNITAAGTTPTPLTQVSFRICDKGNSSLGVNAGYTVVVSQFGTARTYTGDPVGGVSC